MYRVISLLEEESVDQMRQLAGQASFAHGRVSNPHNLAKDNLQISDPAAYQHSGELLRRAMLASPEFQDIAFPDIVAPPMLVRYAPAMKYGLHSDAAFVAAGGAQIRTDLSCTIFLCDPADYDGGALLVQLGHGTMSFKLPAGDMVVYPSNALHQVEPVTRGERLVAISFIQSRIADPLKRDLLYELNEIAALEGAKIDPGAFVKLQHIQSNLLRLWSHD